MTIRVTFFCGAVRGIRLPSPARATTRYRIPFMLILLAALVAAPGSKAADATKKAPGTIYKFGSFPMMAASQVDSVFAPVAAELSKALGQPVLFRTQPSFDEFHQELGMETYDIAVVQPFDYVFAHDQHNYLPVARFEKPLPAIIMVLADSPLKGVEELRGTTIAAPPITAAVTRMAKMAFLDAGINPKNDLVLKYTKSHDSCLQLVMTRSVSACVTSPRSLRIFEDKWGKLFRLLHSTPTLPNTLFVVHKRVPLKAREVLTKTLTSWPGESPAGQRFFEVSDNMRLVPAHDAEYDVVRKFPKIALE